MERIIDHQTNFIAHALGGPAEYTGRELGEAQGPRAITAEAFAEVAAILQETLEDAGMADDDVATVIGIVAGGAAEVLEALDVPVLVVSAVGFTLRSANACSGRWLGAVAGASLLSVMSDADLARLQSTLAHGQRGAARAARAE